MDENQVAVDIREFAEKNNLKLLTPNTPESWSKLVIKHQGCVCVPARKKCPCEFVLDDVKEQNSCKCHLFVNDAYLLEYNDLVGRKNGHSKGKISD